MNEWDALAIGWSWPSAILCKRAALTPCGEASHVSTSVWGQSFLGLEKSLPCSAFQCQRTFFWGKVVQRGHLRWHIWEELGVVIQQPQRGLQLKNVFGCWSILESLSSLRSVGVPSLRFGDPSTWLPWSWTDICSASNDLLPIPFLRSWIALPVEDQPWPYCRCSGKWLENLPHHHHFMLGTHSSPGLL